MQLDSQMFLTYRQLGEFMHCLHPKEAELFLSIYFKEQQNQIAYDVFSPFNPWQLEMLRLAEEFIPEDLNYQSSARYLAERLPQEEMERDRPTYDSRFINYSNASDKPTRGKTLAYSDTEVGFVNAEGQEVRRPINFCFPRYTQDEQKRWHAEWLDTSDNAVWMGPEAGTWRRFIEWDRYSMLNIDFIPGAARVVPTWVDGQEQYLTYNNNELGVPVRIIDSESRVTRQIEIDKDRSVIDAYVLPSGEIATIESSGPFNESDFGIYNQQGQKIRQKEEGSHPIKIIAVKGETDREGEREYAYVLEFNDANGKWQRQFMEGDAHIDVEDYSQERFRLNGQVEVRGEYGTSSTIEKYPALDQTKERRSVQTTDKFVVYGSGPKDLRIGGIIEVFEKETGARVYELDCDSQANFSILNETTIAFARTGSNNIEIHDLSSGAHLGSIPIPGEVQKIIPFSDYRFIVERHTGDLSLIGEKED